MSKPRLVEEVRGEPAPVEARPRRQGQLEMGLRCEKCRRGVPRLCIVEIGEMRARLCGKCWSAVKLFYGLGRAG